jgi:hypothetical protein
MIKRKDLVKDAFGFTHRKKFEEGGTVVGNEPEMVNHPSHYNAGNIEVIDFIDDQEHLGFHCLQAIRYICRSPFKGTEAQDLEKAIWYLKRRVEKLKERVG